MREQSKMEQQRMDGRGDSEETFYCIGLTQVDRLGPVKCRTLVRRFGSAKNVFQAPGRELKSLGGVGEHILKAIMKGDALRSAEREMKYSERNGISVKAVGNPQYPRMLKEIHDAPFVLYQKGEVDFNSEINVAIVGTRKPSGYGRMLAEEFSAFFSERGINVVSGLAYGIDGAAHQAALGKGGKTTAVLGHGLQTIYPREHRLKARDICGQGALLTEFTSQTGPDGRNFPLRNRIISGLCHATIVVEAGIKGGALITARSAFDQNREVYAVPGDIHRPMSVGCNQLIKDQVAKILVDPQDVLQDIAPMIKTAKEARNGKSELTGLTQNEIRIVKFLNEQEALIEEIANALQMKVQSLYVLLLNLEIKRAITQAPGGRYRSLVH